MQKTLPLYLGPSVIGSVVIEENDGHLTLLAKTYASLHGICRAYVKSAHASLLIGVLAPDGSAFSSRRHFSKSALSNSNISFDEISYAYAVCKEYAEEPDGKASFTSEILEKNKVALVLSKSTGARLSKTESGIEIAVPLFSKLPFPRPDVMCIMTPKRINGELFAVISVSPDGKFIPLSRHT